MVVMNDLLPQRKRINGTFGLEIETEVLSELDYGASGFFDWIIDSDGHKSSVLPSKNWVAVTDGSLRNYGVEFILKNPLSYTSTLSALDEFSQMFANVKFIEGAPATSVHVHVNMREETPLVMINFITICLFFENVLIDFAGDTRRSNVFAPPLRHVEGNLHYILKIISRLDQGTPLFPGLGLSESAAKYINLNLVPLYKLGSLEIRCFRGTTDVSLIKTWVGMINKMLLYAKQPGMTPHRFLSSSRGRELELLSDVFEEFSHHLKHEYTLPMIFKNLKYIRRIVESVRNWDVFGLKYDERLSKKPKAKAQDDILDEFLSTIPAPQPWTTNTVIFDETSEIED